MMSGVVDATLLSTLFKKEERTIVQASFEELTIASCKLCQADIL